MATSCLSVVQSPVSTTRRNQTLSPTYTVTRKRARIQSLSTDFPEFHLPSTPFVLVPYGKSIFHRGLGQPALETRRQGTSETWIRFYIGYWMSRADLVIAITLRLDKSGFLCRLITESDLFFFRILNCL